MSKTGLLIIDSHALAYRAYFAMQQQNLMNPVTGQPTGAVYGFLRMMFKVIMDTQPEMTAVVWDAKGKNFRHEMYKEYKATRKPMPDDLRGQIDEIKELVAKAGFENLEAPGFEADDLMGGLGKRFGKRKNVILLSGDKDLYQILTKKVRMLRPSKGVSEFIEIDPEWVETELGVTVKQIPDYMAIVGDTSDNIPGAKGVGPKGAAKLLQEYKTLDGIYKNIEKITAKALKSKLETDKENVYLSKKLATIDVDLKEADEVDEEKLFTPNFLEEDIRMIFRREGYNQIYAELNRAVDRGVVIGAASKTASKSAAGAKTAAKSGAASKAAAKSSGAADTGAGTAAKKSGAGPKYELVDTLDGLKKVVTELSKAELISVDTETDNQQPMLANLVGVSLAAKKGRAWYVALPPAGSDHADKGIELEQARPLLKKLLGTKKIAKVGQNIKYDFIVLRRHGIEMEGIQFDTMIASYLCNPNVRRHNMDDMALDILGHTTIKYSEVVGSGRNQKTMDQLEPEAVRDYACEDADITLQLYQNLVKMTKKQKLEKVNEEIEIPLLTVLADMEQAGVTIDVKYFKKLSKSFERKLTSLENRIYKAAGYEFNVNSTKELQKLLFEDLNLPKGKKTKTGYSTDHSVLETLSGLHPVADYLLEHRKYGKLKSTYVDALPALIHPESGRIHTSLNQTIAATGRLSSVDPNLQNIPIREETGRMIRQGFIPREGHELLSLDYSQIELRVMAHYSKDKALIEAFAKEGLDVHARTASSLFGVDEDKVDPDMRSQAKAVNFSIIYGVTEFGLSRNLGIPREAAREYIEKFFAKYPGVRKYMDDTIAFAEKHGHVETLFGRIRQIAEIKSSNRFRREGAQRTAINTPVQGTSADIIKMAMLKIHADMKRKKLRSHMMLQVHDELLFDVVPEEKDEVLNIAKSRMEKIVKLKVPLKVDYGFGKNWDEAH